MIACFRDESPWIRYDQIRLDQSSHLPSPAFPLNEDIDILAKTLCAQQQAAHGNHLLSAAGSPLLATMQREKTQTFLILFWQFVLDLGKPGKMILFDIHLKKLVRSFRRSVPMPGF